MCYFVATRVSEKLRGLRQKVVQRYGLILAATMITLFAMSASVVAEQPTDYVDAPGASAAAGQQSGASASATATIRGTVVDVNGQLIPGATVVLHDGSAANDREVTADKDATFDFDGLRPGTSYHVSVSAAGLTTWHSPEIILKSGQYLYLTGVQLDIPESAQTVTVYATPTEIAEQQLHAEEQQRVLGIIPNFYVVYDSSSAVPLTPKMKFKLAMKVSTDPVTAAGILTLAGVNQLAHRPDYQLGAKGYGQRVGAAAADSFSDLLIGGAILPSLLHQDPRYFYQGAGSKGSRIRHAVSSPFITRGENGHMQPNYSSIGGDIAASSLLMTYYPDSNRSAGMVFQNFAIDSAERVVSAVAQEFILPHLMLKKSQ